MTGGARRVTTPDGVDLALHRLRAYRDGRPAVLLVHGAFTNHHFWLHAGMAHFLGAAGFDIWLADLRHHGESAREPRRGAWTFEDWVLHDTPRSEEHTSELQSRLHLVCRLLLEKKKITQPKISTRTDR